MIVVVVQVHIEEGVVHGRTAAATATTIRLVADTVFVPMMMAAVTVIVTAAATAAAVVRVRAVLLSVYGGRDAVTVQVCVAQTVGRRDDDGRFGRLQRVLVIVMAVLVVVLVVMVVVLVMVTAAATDVGRQLIVSTVAAVIRTVIGRRRVLLVVALGRVRWFEWRPSAQTLRQVVVGHQSAGAAVIIVGRGRRVRGVRHHVAAAAAAAVDRTAAARVVVHSHVCRLRNTTANIIYYYYYYYRYEFSLQWRDRF